MSEQIEGAPIMVQFEEAIDAVVDRFRDQGLTYGEAVGALENVKLFLFLQQQEEYIRRIATEP